MDGDLVVETSKDLSNVKFYADGVMIRELDGLSGYENSFAIPAGADEVSAKAGTTSMFKDIDQLGCVPDAGGDDGTNPGDDDEDDDVDEAAADKIGLCHATGSETNPFVYIEVAKAAVLTEGHGSHEDDIIPAFDGFDGVNTDMVDLIEQGCVETDTVDEDEDEVEGDELDDDDTVGGEGPGGDTPGTGDTPDSTEVDRTPTVEGEVIRNPTVPAVSPAVRAPASAGPSVGVPARADVLGAAAVSPQPADAQVLGSQVDRAPGGLARTGDSTTNLVPFGLALVLLGLGVQRSAKRFAAARVR